MILILIAFVAMFIGDTAQGVYVLFENTRPWFAGFCDGLNDWAAFFSIGMTGASAVRFIHGRIHLHLGWLSVGELLGIMTGSLLGGRLGRGLARYLESRLSRWAVWCSALPGVIVVVTWQKRRSVCHVDNLSALTSVMSSGSSPLTEEAHLGLDVDNISARNI